MWTIEHEADIASDLSAFHRVDDPLSIDGPRYFSLAQRLTAYSGVLGALAAERERRKRDGEGGASGTASAPARVSDDVAIAQLSDGWIEHTNEGGAP
jgi:hypothetical protein